MDEKSRTVLSISDLIRRGRPLAAASSLVPSATLQLHKVSNSNHYQRSSFSISQTLKPLNHSTLLIGIVTLPSFADWGSPIKCTCFQFSDDSASLCCDILGFNPEMIGKKVRILAWNFVPLKCGNRRLKDGFLEIITWDFFYPCCGKLCSFSDFNCFCLSLGACNVEDNLIFGVIQSISPLSVVPCASGENGSRNINGFLVNFLICQCKYCASVSELRDLCEKNAKDHCFTKSVVAYFCGLASSWHPVISKFIGDVALVTGLKKKLVFLRKEESQLMYVTTDEVSLHTKLFTERGLNHDTKIRGKGECGSYTGFITGSYMQGMVLELDQEVMLLSTDQHLSLPHSVRVGALVTLKNVHFVDPKFPWGKMFILDACCKTSVHVESFSPLESRCHLKSHSPSLLQKFIDSLSSAARFWSLLVISCFRKKFTGILSAKEILGSKHKEGLAQKYARLHLPSSAFQLRHGVLLEFCRHDLCFEGKEVDYSHLRLVVPIANLISYCEASWKEVLNEHENNSDFTGRIIQNKPQWCSGRTFVKSIKRVLCSEEIGVLVLGTLKISLSTGRLQLVDATGSVDIVLDLPATWASEKIFEAKDFKIIIEGIPPKLVDMDSTIYQPLSCQSLFSNALPLERLKKSIYLCHCPSDENSESRSHFFHRREKNSLDFDSGKYHLLVLTHKFPVLQKFLGDLPNRSNMFAEAIVLPWYLLVYGKHKDSVMTMVYPGHCKNSVGNFARSQKHLAHKRCKCEQNSAEVSKHSLNDAENGLSSFCSSHSSSCIENTSVSNNWLEFPFLTAGKGVNLHWKGMLHSTDEHSEFISDCKLPRRKILLEFGLDSFCEYEALKIGRCYLVKHQEALKLCNTKENNQVSCAKVFITSGTHISSVTFSSVECLQSASVVDGFPLCNLPISSDELIPKGCWEYEIPCLIGNSGGSGIYSDVNIFVPSSALNLLENIIKMVCIPDEPIDSFAEETGIHDHSGSIASMQPSITSCSDCSLPEGNLITLQGLVLAFHDCHSVPFPAQRCARRGEGSLLMFLQEHAGVCVHVFTDNHIVTIFCNLKKETYPVGLGRDVYATFHRILVLRLLLYIYLCWKRLELLQHLNHVSSPHDILLGSHLLVLLWMMRQEPAVVGLTWRGPQPSLV
ncbi:hypothetical protein ACS0TY_013800 [Phlomoides rotata]